MLIAQALTQQLDLYCERCSSEFWAEPCNAISNLSFWIAAFFLSKLARQRAAQTVEISSAIGFCILVGAGSFVFHTFATVWAMWLDIIPILILQSWCTWLYSVRVMKFPKLVAVGLLAINIAGGISGNQLKEILNGSLTYAPSLIMLAVGAIWHFRQQRQEPSILLAATGVFFSAVCFRTIDPWVCPSFPLGTHFVWHLLNGVTVYLVIRSLIFELGDNSNSDPIAPV